MARRILLVDDEVAVLLTMKAILEISGFEVDTAASAREGKSRLRTNQYHMIITDMRMESDAAGREVIQAARKAEYHPAVALLTAFPVDEADWQDMGAHQLLLKPMHTRVLLEQIEKLFESHTARLARLGLTGASEAPVKTASKKAVSRKATGKKVVSTKAVSKKMASKKAVSKKRAGKPITAKPAKKTAKSSKKK